MSDKEVVRYEKALAEYSITPAKVKEMAEEFQDLAVILDDVKSYKAAHDAKKILVKTRTGVDKRRLELGEDARKWVNTVNRAAKDLLAPITPIEDRFKAELAAEDARIEKIETDRVDGIKAKIDSIRFNMMQAQGKDSATLSIILDNISTIQIDEFYAEFQDEARAALDEVKAFIRQAHGEHLKFEQEEADRKAEAERLAKQKAEQEAEAARLKAIADEQEKARKAQEMEARKEREAIEEEKIKIQAEKDKIEAAKKTEQDRKAMAAFEKEALEKARIRAEQEAKEEAVRKESARIAKAEAEKAEHIRKAALLPDKTKLLLWVEWLQDDVNIAIPTLQSEEAKTILYDALHALRSWTLDISKRAEEL